MRKNLTYCHRGPMGHKSQPDVHRRGDTRDSPVLPSFDGHIPNAVQQMFPNASIQRSHDWLEDGPSYSENYLLEPSDPLFAVIGAAFMQKLTEEYGVADFYNADTFNEMNPNSTNLAYLANTSRSVYQAVTSVNPNAIWIMQTWLLWSNSKLLCCLELC